VPNPTMILNGETAEEWATREFEFDDCEECGRGAEGHDIVPFLGNWFARCKPKRRKVRNEEVARA
jgi:hypothetical protein